MGLRNAFPKSSKAHTRVLMFLAVFHLEPNLESSLLPPAAVSDTQILHTSLLPPTAISEKAVPNLHLDFKSLLLATLTVEAHHFRTTNQVQKHSPATGPTHFFASHD